MDEKTFAEIKSSCDELAARHKDLIKAIWVYGSAVRKEDVSGSDIDLMIIVDDTRGDIPESDLSALMQEVSVFARKMRDEKKLDLHFQEPRTLSSWWDLMRCGEPWAFTNMRDALPIYDPSGYVTPLQKLLREGRLSGTEEKAQILISRAPAKIEKARRILMEEITSDLLEAMVEGAQAVLMFAGVAPPSAKNVALELREHFVSRGLLDPAVVRDYESFYEFTRKIGHGEITRVSGKEIDKYLEESVVFIEQLEKLFVALEALKKKKLVEEAHGKAFEACRHALGKAGKDIPASHEGIIEAFREHFVSTGMVHESHLNFLRKVNEHKHALDEGKVGMLPEKDIYSNVLYAKNLEDLLGGVIEGKGKKREKEEGRAAGKG